MIPMMNNVEVVVKDEVKVSKIIILNTAVEELLWYLQEISS